MNASSGQQDIPLVAVPGSWHEVFEGAGRIGLEQALPGYIAPRRWFGSKARGIKAVRIVDVLLIAGLAHLLLLRVDFNEGQPETYQLPLAFARGPQADALSRERPAAVVARLQAQNEDGVLYDAVWEPAFCQGLLEAIGQELRVQGASGELLASATSVFPRLRGNRDEALPPRLLGVEQSNTSIRYGDRLILKLFRKLEAGANPDLEIGQFLTEKAAFPHIPAVAGALEYRRSPDAEPISLAILQGFVSNRGDAWAYTLEALGDYFQRLAGQGAELALPQEPSLALAGQAIPAQAGQLIGEYLASARLLGQRTAELHLALAAETADPAFAPEAMTLDYQRGLHKAMTDLSRRILAQLQARFAALPEEARPAAQEVLARRDAILQRFDSLLERRISALRTRTHGDYHLGQVLYTGQDFMIIDFEGEPARTLAERRQKRSPLQDVAGMLRSFHYAAYAAYAAYFAAAGQPGVQPEQRSALETWARYWHHWVSAAFLGSYLRVAGATFLPDLAEELRVLLDAYLLEKAVYELGYELNNRPDWLRIPLRGILQTL